MQHEKGVDLGDLGSWWWWWWWLREGVRRRDLDESLIESNHVWTRERSQNANLIHSSLSFFRCHFFDVDLFRRRWYQRKWCLSERIGWNSSGEKGQRVLSSGDDAPVSLRTVSHQWGVWHGTLIRRSLFLSISPPGDIGFRIQPGRWFFRLQKNTASLWTPLAAIFML